MVPQGEVQVLQYSQHSGCANGLAAFMPIHGLTDHHTCPLWSFTSPQRDPPLPAPLVPRGHCPFSTAWDLLQHAS